MCNHPKINASKGIGISGVSKGGELALAMAAFLPQHKVGPVAVFNTITNNSVVPVTYKEQEILKGKTRTHTKIHNYTFI